MLVVSTAIPAGAPGHGLSPMPWLPGTARHAAGSRSSWVRPMVQLRSVAGLVQADIAKVDHQIRGAGTDGDYSVPVGLRLRRRRRQVGVRHQDHPRRGHAEAYRRGHGRGRMAVSSHFQSATASRHHCQPLPAPGHHAVGRRTERPVRRASNGPDQRDCSSTERRDCARSPRASRSHSVMPSIYITSRLTFGRSGVTG